MKESIASCPKKKKQQKGLNQSVKEKLNDTQTFAPLCIKIGGWFFITTFDVSSTFSSVFVYIPYTVKTSHIYWLHSEVDRSPVFTLSKHIDVPWEKVSFPMLIRCKGCHFLENVSAFW